MENKAKEDVQFFELQTSKKSRATSDIQDYSVLKGFKDSSAVKIFSYFKKQLFLTDQRTCSKCTETDPKNSPYRPGVELMSMEHRYKYCLN